MFPIQASHIPLLLLLSALLVLPIQPDAKSLDELLRAKAVFLMNIYIFTYIIYIEDILI